ncbi:MAG TPA: ATP-binding protein [Candidatus Polarisedimenticolia bacterium]|nr:ATP-binding protein [Candidatus Polarisedimenticolia bacterium]
MTGLPLRLEPARLDVLVDECLDEAEPEISGRSLSVARLLARAIPEHPLDRLLMKEAVRALLDEAIRRAGEAARLRVMVKSGPNALMFAVKAPGAGLDAAQREALFEKKPLPGTPARARAIVTAHGGSVWANGMPGKGVTFYATLPVRRAP